MVQTCCVKNCKERQKRGVHISFHHFPRNPKLKEQWINAIKHDNFVHSPHSRVCSKHFTTDQYMQSPWSSRQMLKADAVPNKELPMVMLCEPDVPKTQYIKGSDIPSVSSIETDNESTRQVLKADAISNKELSMVVLCEPDVSETQHIEERDNVSSIETDNESISSMDEENILLEKPVRKKWKIYAGDFKAQNCISDKENYVQIISAILEKKTKQIKRLQEKNKRLTKKINDLQSLVDDLRKT